MAASRWNRRSRAAGGAPRQWVGATADGEIMDRRSFGKGVGVGVVLITRPEPGATETAHRVAAMGLTPVIAPVLEVVGASTTPRGLDRIAASLLTSRNAVAPCPALCHERPVFTVGDATAGYAREVGFRDVRSASGNALALAALVAESLRPEAGPLFLPTGHQQGNDLAKDLRQRGFRVLRRVVYWARPAAVLPEEARAHLRKRDVSVVLFFSGETARHFVRLLRVAQLVDTVDSVDAVAISERATVALKDLPWRRVCVASKPNQEAMLALLK